MKLNELLEAMENAMNRYDLSDDFLEAIGCETGRIGEIQYGVSSVPCNWVYPYLKALSEDERLSDIVDEIEEQLRDASNGIKSAHGQDEEANAIPVGWIKKYANQFPEDSFPFKKMLDTWEMETEPDTYSAQVPGKRPSHIERTRAAVYATGNKWAIENFEATH